MPKHKNKTAAVLESQCAQLMEHFDSVQIFVTKHNKLTRYVSAFHVGDGNYYARLGQVREWIMIEDEREKIKLKRVMNDIQYDETEDDESEERV